MINKKNIQKHWVAQGGAVKSKEEGKIEGMGIVFGSPEKPDRSSYKDYFDASTIVNPSDSFTTHLVFEHGHKRAEPIGTATMTKGEKGWEVSAELNMEDPFVQGIFPDVKSGKYGFSTGAVSHVVKRTEQENGTNHLKQWFVGELSLTKRPAEELAMITAVKYLPDLEDVLDNGADENTEPPDVPMDSMDVLKQFIVLLLSQLKSEEVKISEESIKQIVQEISSAKAENTEAADLTEKLATKTQELADLEGKLQVSEDALKEANDQITRLSLLAGVEEILKEK